MITDPALNTALRHWGVRAIPFSDTTGEAPFPSPAWEQALRLLEQTAALRSLMLLHGDNGVGKSALEEIRLLLGLNLARQPVLALILIGDLYLQETLRLGHHRALYSRIAAHFALGGLEPDQIQPYLLHGLRQVGLDRPVLKPAALDLLATASQGLPRLLNLLARSAWLAAAQANANSIEPEHVQTALQLVPSVADRIHR